MFNNKIFSLDFAENIFLEFSLMYKLFYVISIQTIKLTIKLKVMYSLK